MKHYRLNERGFVLLSALAIFFAIVGAGAFTIWIIVLIAR